MEYLGMETVAMSDPEPRGGKSNWLLLGTVGWAYPNYARAC
jgi:hypothetical protein